MSHLPRNGPNVGTHQIPLDRPPYKAVTTNSNMGNAKTTLLWIIAACAAVVSISGTSASTSQSHPDAAILSPPIKVWLKTQDSWPAPPFVLEIIFSAEEIGGSAVPFLSMLSADGLLSSDVKPKQIYEALFIGDTTKDAIQGVDSFVETPGPKILQFLSSPASLGLAKLSLAIHSTAPRIQAHYRFYMQTVVPLQKKTRFDPSCPVWANWAGRQICSVDEIRQLLSLPIKPSTSAPPLLPFDHIYQSPIHVLGTPLFTVIFYVDVLAPEFKDMFTTLRDAVATLPLQLVLRYKPPHSFLENSAKAGNPLYLSGYGVELAIKSTEYKVEDDREIKSDIADVYTPDTISNINKEEDEFLFQAIPTIKSLSKEKLNDISFKTASYIAQSASPLDTLVLVTQNFPKYAHILSTFPVDKNIRDTAALIRQPSAASNQLYLNGHSVELTRIDAFNRYTQFSRSLKDLLRPSYPGQLKYIRRNLFTSILLLDLTNAQHIAVASTSFSIIEASAPLRFANIAAKSLYWIKENGRIKHIKQIIDLFSAAASTTDGVTAEVIKESFLKVTGKEYDSVFNEREAQTKELLKGLSDYSERLGINQLSGAVFSNGKYIEVSASWQKSIVETYSEMVEYLTADIYTNQVTNNEDLYEYFLNMNNVYSKLAGIVDGLPWLYGTDSPDFAELSLVVFGDFSTAEGVKFALAAAQATTMSSRPVRISFLHNGAQESSDTSIFVDEAAFHILAKPTEGSLPIEMLKSAIKEDTTKFDGFNPSDEFRLLRRDAMMAIRAAAYVKAGEYGVIANSRFISPLMSSELFDLRDFESLISFELHNRASEMATLISTLKDDMDARSEISDLHFKTQSLVISANVATDAFLSEGPPPKRISSSQFLRYIYTGDFKTAAIHFTALIDPTSNLGQKTASILETLSKVQGVAIEVFLNPQGQGDSDQLPLKRFYRYVLGSEPIFDSHGDIAPVGAHFKRIPTAPLLTLGMDVVGAWLVRPTRSLHDLDNIKLSSLPADASMSGVEADFELQSILVEGHASDAATAGPPRGLQFVLGSDSEPNMVDTITMANLGYLQLKANPGVWHLRIREGRSRLIYNMESLRYMSSNGTLIASSKLGDDGATVIVDSFEGVIVFPNVAKRPGMMKEDVLLPLDKGAGGIWDIIKKSTLDAFGSGSSTSETINVFSVASGHLYERFLSIMMLSVKQQTKNPVKFWLIEDFLSPSFMEFLPHLAKAYKFDYELVTYKWPKWLREQTEKQRIIWGYKILFLDVLFPLKIDKVIFVDADQVVRANLKELVDIDLQGAVYGYTPFCSDRTDMDGFRFWKQGFWQSHLQGRPYHISALYVIDLVKFREVAAGDRLRQQYHMLSADPNSLANLDQDLPNSMIHQIPMFSLPQEWLWCETWCSDASLKQAKTIDLCNNPLTKEPKLARARRILPEWEGLDKQVQDERLKFEALHRKTSVIVKPTAVASATPSAVISTAPPSEPNDEAHSEL
ncbi:hypothetical protein BASA60_010892 [Batrachochytrium salamandrivorans]|nr:hypothetical protein BASA60_010892 [Batrachochytrium salamandrivorans]